VEDLVRDIAVRLNADDRIPAYTVSSENFESIHNQSAQAMIQWDNDKDGPLPCYGQRPTYAYREVIAPIER
jgi:GTP cyclohydrolase I